MRDRCYIPSGLQHFWKWCIWSKYFSTFWRREREKPLLTTIVNMTSPACWGVCGLDPVSGRSKSIWTPPKGAKQGLYYQIWVSQTWWPAPSSLSLLLNPNGLLGLEANVLKVILCSCHATGARIMGTKSCWIGWVCSFLSVAPDQTPWPCSKLMLASLWDHWTEFLS